MTLITINIIVASYIVRIFELPYYRLIEDAGLKGTMDSYFNAIYLTTITLTTVGYGDMAPCTCFGRGFIMLIAIVGAFYIALLVNVMNSVLELGQE